MKLTLNLSASDLIKYFTDLIAPSLGFPSDLEWVVDDFETDEDGELLGIDLSTTEEFNFLGGDLDSETPQVE